MRIYHTLLFCERLKTYLSVLGIDSGETPHSMTAGCAVTLAMSGKVKTREMMDHIGWSSGNRAEYYSRSAKLFDSGIVAQELANSVVSAQQVETEYQVNADFTNLQRLCGLKGCDISDLERICYFLLEYHQIFAVQLYVTSNSTFVCVYIVLY